MITREHQERLKRFVDAPPPRNVKLVKHYQQSVIERQKVERQIVQAQEAIVALRGELSRAIGVEHGLLVAVDLEMQEHEATLEFTRQAEQAALEPA